MRTPLVNQFKDNFDIATLLDITDMLYSLPEDALPSFNELRDALSTGQIESKLWILQEVVRVLSKSSNKILILGGWLGILSRLLFNEFGETIESITSIDIDAKCEEIARKINLPYANKFTAKTADAYEFDYSGYDIIINTSCEHFIDVNKWIKQLPLNIPIVAQSNNFDQLVDHVSCVNSPQEFINQLQLTNVIFSGELKLLPYTRYMVIGSL